jgi:integrase
MKPRKPPSYRLHKASGQAVVTIDGRDHYLGRYDTPASHEAYGRKIAAWKAGTLTTPRASNGPALTIAGMVAAYYEAIDGSGKYTKEGKPTSERYCLALALRPLVRLFATAPAATFGPLDLLTVRKELCKPMPPPKEGEKKRKGRVYTGPLARSTVNANVKRIRRVFRWAAAMQLVPVTTWQALEAVEGLRRGESADVREPAGVQPVSPRAVAITLRQVRDKVAAMIRLQWLSGMRPEEVTQMRTGDIDRSGPVWVYRPRTHKMEHQGRTRAILLGPRCQRILAPFLSLDPAAWLFSGRQLPGKPARHLSEGRYRGTIRRACIAAGIPPWAPNQLRHSAATRARSHADLDTASVLLGHAGPDTTLVYAEADMRRAAAFAQAHG